MAVALALGGLLAACAAPAPRQASAPAESDPVGLTANDVVNASPLEDPSARFDLSDIDMLALSPDMRAFIDEHVDRSTREADRLAQLLYAVLGGDRFTLAYDDSTRTAASTFRAGRGNCLSFTNMFIAMARDLGLTASYQEVEIPPDWSLSGQTFLIAEHVNVLVEVKNALSRVVDFNSYDTIVDVETESEVITDARARAHYFNNIGVERMLDDDVALAYANMQQSIREDHTFDSAWVNMGILHRREGLLDYAEVAYLQAL
ncbi:MAG: transglutaminase family protein, partial [Xanthomonadales bacterium]|nr:transglutaminase family protein [Xanthomonadales bacterium]